MKRKVAILGSTGSIGTQALQVIEAHSDLYEAYILTANSQADLLIEQARRHCPAAVCIADDSKYQYVKQALENEPIQVYAGRDALCQVATHGEVDVVLVALVGIAGLEPTISAIKAHKTIALANKETLVVAGELVTRLAMENGSAILPVDSEHSAIFQSLMGEEQNKIEEIILTASGGPFRHMTSEQMSHVSLANAMHHPSWNMGAKITIDSATMMNKGFEVIEAKWLFGVGAEKIRVVVHPQSIVHSAVLFRDGAVKAQLGMPDMRIPIQFALSYPLRLQTDCERIDWYSLQQLTFEKPDTERFRCLQLAYEAIRRGGNATCVLNAANEVVNLAFRKGRCSFLDMPDVIERTMNRVPLAACESLDDYLACDLEARRITNELMN